MFLKVVLILDKRIEQSTKYKKMLESIGVGVFCENKISSAIKILNNYEPDLILISDSLDDDQAKECRKLKVLSANFRPTIVALSKSAHLQDKLDTLESGADDFWSEPVESEEFKARINAHLRRNFESRIDTKTGLADFRISQRTLKRIVQSAVPFACLKITINNLNFYKEIYGDLAYEKMLQTYCAIINSVLDEKDYLGLFQNDEFFLITQAGKMEKIAQFLVYAFDSVSEKFYSEQDSMRGYLITQNDEIAEKKVALVSTSIGAVSNENKKYNSLKQVLNALDYTHKLAKSKQGSNYIIDRPKLKGENSLVEKEYNNKILIIEEDESLSLLLSTTAALKGYEVEVINNYDVENIEDTDGFALIIIDAGQTPTLKGLALCEKIKNNASTSFEGAKIILTSILHDKQKMLDAGVDLYLPKPYELSQIFSWVDKFVKEYNFLR